MASSQKSKIISLRDLILKYQDKLTIDELDRLMALALHKNIAYIYKHPGKKLSRSNILAFKKILRKRLTNWSLAVLKGQKEFFGLNFLVNKYTLIPRPESELIVEEALKSTADQQNILDIGTGSGALILSLAKNNNHLANYTATDISGRALKIAQSNSRKLKLKNTIKFIKTDLLAGLAGKFDIIMANLPYLTPEQMKEPSISKEPASALLSGHNGLDHYQKLLKQLPNYLNKKYVVLLEIDPSQAEQIKKIIEDDFFKASAKGGSASGGKIKFIKDLAQNIRLVKITD